MSHQSQPVGAQRDFLREGADDVGGQTVRVLLVEDDPSDRHRVRDMLERSDTLKFEIEHSVEVEEALGMLQQGCFDVVLLDLTLPEGDGLDTLARAKVAAASVPIIAMASDEDDTQAAHAIRMGAQECLIKVQIEPRVLIRTLRHAVERHQLIEQLHIARRREHYLAAHDSLTGLANRYALEQHLKHSLALSERSGRQVAVLFLDLDRFKNINDTKGHPVGDSLLRLTTDRLRWIVRKSDLIARFGGDEFVFLIHGVEREHAPAKLAEKILGRLSEPYELEGGQYQVTGSIGIAIFPQDGTTPAALIRSADTAMYRAKARGGNCYQLYDESMNKSVTKRFTMECRMRDAVENGTMAVHYQPRVSFETGRIVGCEALLRWSDPVLGAVSPADFVPLAEETNLIGPLGSWVLRQACEQVKVWQQAGFPDLDVSVNASAAQLTRDALRASIVDTLWETGFAPALLQLELTESVLMREEPEAIEVLQEIARMGIRIALDDFGTGFSSLSYLKSIPISSVKIDRSFVRHLVINSDDSAIIEAVVSIAEKLDLQVVAEGVETTAQREALRRLGCDEFQGFLVAPALPPDEFLDLLRRQGPSPSNLR